jgi:hypothetical protein
MHLTSLFREFVGPRSHTKSRSIARRRVLRLEALEQREVPASNIWIGASGGNWSSPTNWSLGHIPQGGDTLVFSPGLGGANTNSRADISVNVAGITTNVDYTATITVIANRTVSVGGATFNGGTLQLSGNSALNATGDITNYASITTTGSLGNTISAGTLYVYAPGSVSPNAGVTFQPALTVNAGFFQGAGSTLNVGLNSQTRVDFNYAVTLNGTTNLAPGSRLISNSTSSITVTGVLNFNGSNITTVGGLNLANGILNSNVPGDSVTGNFTNSGGTLQFNGPQHVFTVNGNFTQFIGTTNMRLNDGLSVNGIATLQGYLNISNPGSGPPPLGFTRTLISASNGMSVNFTQITFPPLNPGLQ